MLFGTQRLYVVEWEPSAHRHQAPPPDVLLPLVIQQLNIRVGHQA